MKENKLVIIDYVCDYCGISYRIKDQAVKCEESHIPVGVGSEVQFSANRRLSNGDLQSYIKAGTIVKEKDGCFLVEHSDDSRTWAHTWEVYRYKYDGDV